MNDLRYPAFLSIYNATRCAMISLHQKSNILPLFLHIGDQQKSNLSDSMTKTQHITQLKNFRCYIVLERTENNFV